MTLAQVPMTARNSWMVRASGPPEGQHKWRPNLTCCIFADTLQEALSAFLMAYPDATVWGIQHEGKRLVVDASLLEGTAR